MNQNELKKRARIFQDAVLVSTLHLTSARKKDDNLDKSLDTHALDASYGSANIDCIDFDKLKLILEKIIN